MADNKPKIAAGSIRIDKIMLTSDINGKNNVGNQYDIRALVQEFNIFESLSSHFLSADLVISDALSLTTIAPIVGQETVEISFKTPHDSVAKPITLKFKVVSIENLQRAKLRTASYIIHLASVEYFQNIKTSIMKAYVQQPVSQMAKSVITDYLGVTDKTIDVAETSGQRTIVIPNMHPTRALDFLAQESFSGEYPASNFIFYENCDGYHFKTLDQLIARKDTKGIPIDQYHSSPKDWDKGDASPRSEAGGNSGGAQLQSTKPFELTKINHFNIISLFTNDRVAGNGGWENTSFYVDPVNSEYGNIQYRYYDNFTDLQHATSAQAGHFISEQNHLTGDGSSFESYWMTNHSGSGVDQDQKPLYWHLAVGSKALLDNILVQISIPGDTDRRAGDTVRLKFPEFAGTDDLQGNLNKFFSGNYLVLSVRHIYNSDGYACVMICAKNCYQKDVVSNISPEVQDVEPEVPPSTTPPVNTPPATATPVPPSFPTVFNR